MYVLPGAGSCDSTGTMAMTHAAGGGDGAFMSREKRPASPKPGVVFI
jgi:hypothetical protein